MIIEEQSLVNGVEEAPAVDDRPSSVGEWPIPAPATTCLPGHRGFRPGSGTHELQ